MSHGEKLSSNLPRGLARMTGKRAPGCACSWSLTGRMCGGVRASDLRTQLRTASRECRNGHCQRRDVARRRTFPRNVRMFVDYLVTSMAGVGYGDLYKGRAEVVSGVATNWRMMCVRPYFTRRQSSLFFGWIHTGVPTSTSLCLRDFQQGFAQPWAAVNCRGSREWEVPGVRLSAKCWAPAGGGLLLTSHAEERTELGSPIGPVRW